MKRHMQIAAGENPFSWVNRIAPFFVGMDEGEIRTNLADIVTTVINRTCNDLRTYAEAADTIR